MMIRNINIPDFNKKLTKYANLTIKVGLNLQPDQRLFIFAESLDVTPFVREVTKSAYKNICKLVSVLWLDEELEKIRYKYAPNDSLKEYSDWEIDAAIKSLENGDAILTIFGKDPELHNDENPNILSIANRTKAEHYKALYELDEQNLVQWSVVCPPTIRWAERVFPNIKSDEAELELWNAVFKSCHIDNPNPVTYWRKHLEEIDKRKTDLTSKNFASLHFIGTHTDLKFHLPDDHIWCGGNSITQSGIQYSPCIPTEEVYTLPYRFGIEGTVTTTKPVSYRGSIIKDIKLKFSKGQIVSLSAKKGENILRDLIKTDETSMFLGEIALVSNNSVISKMNSLFLNTLYDENASNHFAFGNAYRYTLKNGKSMTKKEFSDSGGNVSSIHVDFMFGSDDMNVFGIKKDGEKELIMQKGDWFFNV